MTLNDLLGHGIMLLAVVALAVVAAADARRYPAEGEEADDDP